MYDILCIYRKSRQDDLTIARYEKEIADLRERLQVSSLVHVCMALILSSLQHVHIHTHVYMFMHIHLYIHIHIHMYIHLTLHMSDTAGERGTLCSSPSAQRNPGGPSQHFH
ncbi:hypothetical protein EON63_24760 [archaeon]|nr:MAG: hypothetical protein EON63_24760 [archaeon]